MVKSSTFQPSADKWYHSDAYSNEYRSDATDPANFFDRWSSEDVVGRRASGDKTEMAWRQYNNVTIDTLYFSVFFGGSSPSFQAKERQTIRFAFQDIRGTMYAIRRTISAFIGSVGDASGSHWEKMRPLVDTDLLTSTVFTKPYVGGGCGDIIVTNSGSACEVAG
jgi:hypothetical protein